MEPEGSVPNRRKEKAWLEDTEPYRGARPRTMEFDRPVDGGLGATLGGVEDKDKLRDGVVPELQIQHEEEEQTPPQREPRGNEGHQPRGPRITMNESVLGPGYLAGQRGVQLAETDHTTNGHRWRHWKAQCLVCSGI